MSVRSKRLWATGPLVVGVHLVYTVPVGETALIKSVWMTNPHATQNAVMHIRVGGTGVQFTHFGADVAPQGYSVQEHWIAIPAGTEVYVSNAGPATAPRSFGYGAELEGVAD